MTSADVVLEAHRVAVRYPRAPRPSLASTDVAVAARSLIGIVGESGSGKTTLARVLVGLLPPTTGEVLVEGTSWSSVGRTDERRRRVQMVFQDPYGSLNPRLTARQTVAEVLQVWDGLSASAAAAKAGTLLAEVGLTKDAVDRRPERLSGGQCQRVGIARALAARPSVLVADEPTSSLDVSVQAQILNTILGLSRDRGLALVLISHDLAVVGFATETVHVMYGGHVVETGPTKSIFAAPAHPYTRLLLDSVPGAAPLQPPPASTGRPATGCVFAGSCPGVQAECLQGQPPLLAAGDRQLACLYPIDSPVEGVR